MITIEPGLYRIDDVKSGRFYVGSASSLRARWKQHTHRLARGTHPNPAMQAIWSSDPTRLAFTVLRPMPGATREELLAAEQELLDAAPVGSARCLNVLALAGSPRGRKRTEETKRRMSEAQRGKKASPEARARMRAAKLADPNLLERMSAMGKLGRGRKYPPGKGAGVPRPMLRQLTADQVRDLRAKRAEGMSWMQLAKLAGMKSHMATKRAVLGITYGDVK